MDFTLENFGSAAGEDQGAVMQVRNPQTGADLVTPDRVPITITLAGYDSARVQRAVQNRQEMRLRALGGRWRPLRVREIDEDGLAYLAAATLAWTGIVMEGITLDCTLANARKAYAALPWLRRQVDEFVGDPSNFTGPVVAPRAPARRRGLKIVSPPAAPDRQR